MSFLYQVSTRSVYRAAGFSRNIHKPVHVQSLFSPIRGVIGLLSRFGSRVLREIAAPVSLFHANQDTIESSGQLPKSRCWRLSSIFVYGI